MLIDHVNLNHIRVFECVFRSQSMTVAAKELHLTQSGVSQHIKSLEDMLGTPLFDRIQQKLVPTAPAQILYQSSLTSLQSLEAALSSIKIGENRLAGTISVGMPMEFGNNVVLPLLAQFCRKNPLVKLKIKFELASIINQELLQGSLDFAFVDDFRLDKRIHTEKVYDEELELCIAESSLAKKTPHKNSKKFFETLEYIDYQEDAEVLHLWFQHHLQTKHISFNLRATVMDVQAVARLIINEVGAGVLPGHHVLKLQKEGQKIHRFKGSGKALKNTISLARLEGRTHTTAATQLMDFLKKSLSHS